MSKDSRKKVRESLLIQPYPLDVVVLHEVDSDGSWSTKVARTFAPEDVPRCRLCPQGRCGASRLGMCLVSVPGFVPDELTPLLAIDTLPLPAPGLPRIHGVSD